MGIAIPTGEIQQARASAAAARRASLLAGDTDSARVVFSEADDVPGLIADRYGDTVVCQFTTAGAEAWREVLADALFELPGVECVYERSDADVREREGLQPRVGLLRGREPSPDLVANESGFRFAVDVAGGHKTGFYLDQRNARAEVARLAAGRRVLNVFSYTGAFSVIAAARGAASVTSIDSSGPALAVAARNGELNGVDVGELIEAARKNPGKLNYGSSAIGSAPHMAAELFKLTTGIDIVHVPYKGSAPGVADLVAEAKKRPGELVFTSWGVGSVAHLLGVDFCRRNGTFFSASAFDRSKSPGRFIRTALLC